MARLLIGIVLLFGLAACETVEGAGEDVQNAGNAIENTTDEIAN